jgi:hypothetical protein
MTKGRAIPDRDRFRILAKDSRVIPVTRRLLADGDTPIALYRKLAAERPGVPEEELEGAAGHACLDVLDAGVGGVFAGFGVVVVDVRGP